MRKLAARAALAALILALAACGRDELEDDARYAAAAPDALTDAGIATLVSHVNGAEVGSAKAAFPKLQNASVREYAERMIADHLALEHALDSVGIQADTAKFPPPQFFTMQAVTHSQAQAINTIPPGPAFDRTYVAFQVLNHTLTVDSLRRWHSVADREELKAAIAASLPRVRQHLALAQALQARLGGTLETGPVAPPAPDTSWAQRTKPNDTIPAPPARADTILDRSPPE